MPHSYHHLNHHNQFNKQIHRFRGMCCIICIIIYYIPLALRLLSLSGKNVFDCTSIFIQAAAFRFIQTFYSSSISPIRKTKRKHNLNKNNREKQCYWSNFYGSVGTYKTMMTHWCREYFDDLTSPTRTSREGDRTNEKKKSQPKLKEQPKPHSTKTTEGMSTKDRLRLREVVSRGSRAQRGPPSSRPSSSIIKIIIIHWPWHQ